MTADPAQALLTYGPLGILVVLILTGQLVPRMFYGRLERENDRLREANDRERERADAATQAAITSNQLMGALKEIAAERPGRTRKDPSR